jgi:molecular chaperone GrpE
MTRMSDTGASTADEVVEALPAELGPAPDPHTLGLELPEDKDDAIELLLTEVHACREEAGSYLDDLKRVAADFDNYRKRATKEAAVMLDAPPEDGQGLCRCSTPSTPPWRQHQTDTEKKLYSGMLSTREQLLNALKNEGLEVVPTIDQPFDPEIHEPVGAPVGNGSTLVVTEELRRGYRLRDRVLRAALVVLEGTE